MKTEAETHRELRRALEDKLYRAERDLKVASGELERYRNLLGLIRGDLENLAPELFNPAPPSKPERS